MRGRDLDDPGTTDLRRQVIRDKKFLRRIYEEWYGMISDALPDGNKPVVELGSGAGFLSEYVDGLITSEVFHLPGLNVVMDGGALPFPDASLRGIAMTDVFHHLPDVRSFVAESARCVIPGGRVVMIEPWSTPWSRVIYKNIHHEPFVPEAKTWEFPASGPLSAANGALPWIVFSRDRDKFEAEFPEWSVHTVRPFMPFRYILSGGVSLRSLMPEVTYGAWQLFETALTPLMPMLAMFTMIILERRR